MPLYPDLVISVFIVNSVTASCKPHVDLLLNSQRLNRQSVMICGVHVEHSDRGPVWLLLALKAGASRVLYNRKPRKVYLTDVSIVYTLNRVQEEDRFRHCIPASPPSRVFKVTTKIISALLLWWAGCLIA